MNREYQPINVFFESKFIEYFREWMKMGSYSLSIAHFSIYHWAGLDVQLGKCLALKVTAYLHVQR